MAPESVGNFTLEDFRRVAASGESVPAAVAISAVSASFAFGLLAKALKVSGRRKDFSVDLPKLKKLAGAATTESKRMMKYAQQDIAAFNMYKAGIRLPQATELERKARKRAVNSAVREAIETPLAAARTAAKGIGLCVEAAKMVHINVAADLSASSSLLSSALRVFLLCVDFNIRLLAPDASAYRSSMAARKAWESKAFEQAATLLKHTATRIEVRAADNKRNRNAVR